MYDLVHFQLYLLKDLDNFWSNPVVHFLNTYQFSFVSLPISTINVHWYQILPKVMLLMKVQVGCSHCLQECKYLAQLWKE